MHTRGDEEGVAGDINRVGPFACKSCEGRIDLSDASRLVKLDLQSYGARGAFQISVHAGCSRIVWIIEHGDAYRRGHKLMQELQPLCVQLGIEKIDSSQVSTRPGKAALASTCHEAR